MNKGCQLSHLFALFLLFGPFGFSEVCRARGAEIENWPREISHEKGTLVVYQPQVEQIRGDVLNCRAAVSVSLVGEEEPKMGVIWIQARLATDRDSRTAELLELAVPEVRLEESTPEQEEALAKFLRSAVTEAEFTLAMDRILTGLEAADMPQIADKAFDDTAPEILFSTEPTVLIIIDGDPILQKLEDTGLMHVVNTPFVIVLEPGSKKYYLSAGGGAWYEAAEVKGPWDVAVDVPASVGSLLAAEDSRGEEAGGAGDDPSEPPRVLVKFEPTELIVTDGEPKIVPLPGGELLYLSNTESDVLLELETRRVFVLLSGRWFASLSFEGPWEYVAADTLPPSFAAIPEDSEVGHLLTWVAGSEFAREAVLDAHIPQTAAIPRDGTIEVTYDGDPEFESIEGTELAYAVNTQFQVLRLGEEYYCVEQAIWYRAEDPGGPWTVATEVPAEVQSIPPNSPAYNMKYVEIYNYTTNEVHVGYYPGYTHGYIYHGCLVYGTGWHYRPWYRRHYCPRHSTWGFHVRYNPWHGWSSGFSYSTGRFTFSVGRGGWGGYSRGWWGPSGYNRYHRGYSRGWNSGYRQGARDASRAVSGGSLSQQSRNLYHSGQGAGVSTSPAQSTGSRRNAAAPVAAAAGAVALSNNVFSDNNGNVYRLADNGTWQKRNGGEWNAVARSEGGMTTRSGSPTQGVEKRPAASRETASRPAPSTYQSQQLDRDRVSRERGNQRTQNYQKSRSSYSRSSGRSSGGRRGGRGGGGGRR